MSQKIDRPHLEDLKQIHSEKTARKTLLGLKIKIGMLKKIKHISSKGNSTSYDMYNTIEKTEILKIIVIC